MEWKISSVHRLYSLSGVPKNANIKPETLAHVWIEYYSWKRSPDTNPDVQNKQANAYFWVLVASKAHSIADSTQIKKICQNIDSANVKYDTSKNAWKIKWLTGRCDNNITLKMCLRTFDISFQPLFDLIPHTLYN